MKPFLPQCTACPTPGSRTRWGRSRGFWPWPQLPPGCCWADKVPAEAPTGRTPVVAPRLHLARSYVSADCFQPCWSQVVGSKPSSEEKKKTRQKIQFRILKLKDDVVFSSARIHFIDCAGQCCTGLKNPFTPSSGLNFIWTLIRSAGDSKPEQGVISKTAGGGRCCFIIFLRW